MRKTLTFGSVNSGAYGVYISGSGAFDAPARVYQMLDVAGRNGQLSIDSGRYENLDVKYSAGVMGASRSDFASKIRAFRSALGALTGYQRLTDDYNPDEFRLGIYTGGLSVASMTGLRLATFDLTFYCKPQRFLLSGETPVTFGASGSITNPTEFDAKPMLQITGTGTVGIGDYSMTIRGTSDQVIYIDCDIMEAWTMSGGAKVNANDLVQYAGNKFPSLAAGENGIALGTGITSVVVTPRWWRL